MQVKHTGKIQDQIEALQGAHPMADWRDPLKNVRRVFGQVLFGMAVHDMVRTNLKARGSLEHLFILITFGDLVGVPILPPYYAMRLLPFIVPEINGWRRRMARERDYLDSIF